MSDVLEHLSLHSDTGTPVMCAIWRASCIQFRDMALAIARQLQHRPDDAHTVLAAVQQARTQQHRAMYWGRVARGLAA